MATVARTRLLLINILQCFIHALIHGHEPSWTSLFCLWISSFKNVLSSKTRNPFFKHKKARMKHATACVIFSYSTDYFKTLLEINTKTCGHAYQTCCHMKRDAAEYLTACFSISLNIFIHLFILSLHMTNFQMYAYNKTIF